jgi:hypothetical protein
MFTAEMININLTRVQFLSLGDDKNRKAVSELTKKQPFFYKLKL